MEKMNSLIGMLSKYLLGRETPSERKELYEWYDSIDHSDLPSEEDRHRIGRRVRRRILATASRDRSARRVPYLKPAAIAASVLLVAGLGYWLRPQPDRSAGTAELADVVPGREQAVVVLPSGETVALADIPPEGFVRVGGTVIGKKESGVITQQQDTEKDTDALYTLLTPRAATAEIILADGTKALLNAESKLHYPAGFELGDRVVSLEGEAYFQVAKTSDKSRFIVRAGGQEVQVLGTKFNLRTENGTVRTTLEEGSVRVVAGAENQKELLLASGQQAVWENGSLSARAVDMESVLGWTRGVFHFDGTNTAEVLGQIERWYGIDISYRGNTNTEQYRGRISRSLPLDQLVALLSYADFKVEPRIDKRNRIKLTIN